ncbi:MAG: hypothetical protein OXR83_02850 [Acidobacteriota bacterium]|nr:hypothetical protein [Acidobacteriota bacterium]
MIEAAALTLEAPKADAGIAQSEHAESVEELHQKCGVYTLPAVAADILDRVEWLSDADLSGARLLEPAAGNGEFLVHAATRLVSSFRAQGIEPRTRQLRARITAFEIHANAASEARRRVQSALRAIGVHHHTAAACANAWIRTSDFLLEAPPTEAYTHVVGNPPYIRWSKVPDSLKSLYEQRLPAAMARGDLFLPFLDRCLDLLEAGGKCGILCSDRWLYMAFADRFRTKWLPRLAIESNEALAATAAFSQRVEAYPTILIATKRHDTAASSPQMVRRTGETLEELGCTIKVGPALGHTPAFVLEPAETDAEATLLHPWVDSSEVVEGAVEWQGRRVITLFDDDGELIDLKRFPCLSRRLSRFATQLRTRSIVKKGAVWYRTIDKVRPIDWQPPKLLIPGLARVPRVAIDQSGAVPSHGVYAVFPPSGEVEAVYAKLSHGRLAEALVDIAPTLKRGYVRCYKHFLAKIRI